MARDFGTRDSQQSRMYEAERTVRREGLTGKIFPTLMHAGDQLRFIQRSKWFQRTFGNHRIILEKKRSGSCAQGGYGIIHLPPDDWALTEMVLLHELAHCVRPRDGWASLYDNGGWGQAHGREFCHTFLILVQHYIGTKAAQRLRQEFRTRRVRYTQKRTLSEAQLTTLRERLRTHRAAQRPEPEYIGQSGDETFVRRELALARGNQA